MVSEVRITNKAVIEDHFDIQFELNHTLAQRGKDDQLAKLQRLPPLAGQTSFTRQQEPLGLGHAVWCAREIVGDEPFALILPDMVIKAKPGCLRQLMDVYDDKGGNVIAVEECEPENVSRYGVVSPTEWFGNAFRIDAMIEKPKREDAPSNLIISGRYILQPEIFDRIARQGPGAGGEIQVTDAMIALLEEQAFPFEEKAIADALGRKDFESYLPVYDARRVWSDSSGAVWVSEWNTGNLSRYQPTSGTWDTWMLPGENPAAYAVFVDDADIVWVSVITLFTESGATPFFVDVSTEDI